MTDQPTSLLRLSQIWKRYPGVVALKGVSLEAVGGEVHALLGENGAGKSTLVGIASGSITPDAGSIEISGEPVTALTPAIALQHGLAIVHQEPALLPDLTVEENLALAVPKVFRRSERSRTDWIERQLARVGCTAGVSARMDQLSVAQRQL